MGVTRHPAASGQVGPASAPPGLPRRTAWPQGDGERPVPRPGGTGRERPAPETLSKVLAALRELR